MSRHRLAIGPAGRRANLERIDLAVVRDLVTFRNSTGGRLQGNHLVRIAGLGFGKIPQQALKKGVDNATFW